MKIAVIGKSHLADWTRFTVRHKTGAPCLVSEADLVLIAQDTPTQDGHRDLALIERLCRETRAEAPESVLVLQSQVPPGFTRSLGMPIYHQPETLRIGHEESGALFPGCIVVGCADPSAPLPRFYSDYLGLFVCPILKMTYEEAEFSKIAINITLAAQVDNTNRLAAAATRIGVDWSTVAQALALDPRIGHRSYLKPGRWQDSPHLMRDARTLTEIEE
mgnify:CR=1 FL=1